MTRVVKSDDCGNSPKNALVQEIAIAISKLDLKPVIDRINGDATWQILGATRLVGASAISAHLATGRAPKPKAVVVLHALSHGRTGAANGTVTFADGSVRDFCHVFEFTSASGDRVSAISTYYVDQ
jgi:hypothetical protein